MPNKEQEKSSQELFQLSLKINKKFGIRVLLGGGAVAAGAITATVFCSNEIADRVGHFRYPRPNPVEINTFPKAIEVNDPNISLEQKSQLNLAIEKEIKQREEDMAVFNQLLRHDSSPALVSLSHKVAYDHLTDGVILLRLADTSNNIPQLLDHGKTLIIDNKKLNLEDQFQFHLAEAAIFLKLQLELDEEGSNLQAKHKKDYQTIISLKDRKPSIEYEPDAVTMVNFETLVTMENLFEFIERNNLPQIKRLHFYRVGDPLYEKRHPDTSGSYIDDFSLINTTDSAKTLAHEYGHRLHHRSEFDLNDYQQVFDNFDQNSLVSFEAFVTKYAASEINENYADTFAFYFARGDDFRRIIAQSRWYGPDQTQVLQANYDFFKDGVADGVEFHQLGYPVLTGDHKFGRINPIRLRESYPVINLNPNRDGSLDIPLLINPNKNSELTAYLESGELIIPVGRPTVYRNGKENQRYKFWLVETVSEPKIKGYLAEEWIGE